MKVYQNTGIGTIHVWLAPCVASIHVWMDPCVALCSCVALVLHTKCLSQGKAPTDGPPKHNLFKKSIWYSFIFVNPVGTTKQLFRFSQFHRKSFPIHGFIASYGSVSCDAFDSRTTRAGFGRSECDTCRTHWIGLASDANRLGI